MLTDEEATRLVDGSLRGDGKAFEKLVDAYQRVLFNVALRMVGDYEDANDVTQTVFIKAYENLASFDRKHRFFSWIYRIMINESLNHLHRIRRLEPLEEGIISKERGPEEWAGESEASDIIQAALMELSPEYREVIVLRHFVQLTHREMSGALEIPEKTVKSRLHTARQLLGCILQKRGVALA